MSKMSEIDTALREASPYVARAAEQTRRPEDVRALRALHLNKERARQEFAAFIQETNGMSDDELADYSIRHREIDKAYDNALMAILAFERSMK